jgi:hypothetical protein
MGSFERFKTKTHFNSLKRLVGVTALAALAVKLLTVALAAAAGGGTPWRTARPRSARPRVGSTPDDPDSGGASPSRRSVGVPK